MKIKLLIPATGIPETVFQEIHVFFKQLCRERLSNRV